jgi:SM-20-related protein
MANVNIARTYRWARCRLQRLFCPQSRLERPFDILRSTFIRRNIALIRSHSPAHLDAAGDERHRRIVDTLHEHGWSAQDNFLQADLTLALALECTALAAAGSLTLAQVSRGAARALQPSVRGDQILWLEAGQSAACDQYLAIMEGLRLVLNRELYLGLDEYESHFAFYPPGASYQQHRDQFRDDDSRVVSVVVYLNQDWLPEHGGALRLHPQSMCMRDISPVGGRMALFLSADMLHEVLPATRDRLSLTGWFRRRA